MVLGGSGSAPQVQPPGETGQEWRDLGPNLGREDLCGPPSWSRIGAGVSPLCPPPKKKKRIHGVDGEVPALELPRHRHDATGQHDCGDTGGQWGRWWPPQPTRGYMCPPPAQEPMGWDAGVMLCAGPPGFRVRGGCGMSGLGLGGTFRSPPTLVVAQLGLGDGAWGPRAPPDPSFGGTAG